MEHVYVFKGHNASLLRKKVEASHSQTLFQNCMMISSIGLYLKYLFIPILLTMTQFQEQERIQSDDGKLYFPVVNVSQLSVWSCYNIHVAEGALSTTGVLKVVFAHICFGSNDVR